MTYGAAIINGTGQNRADDNSAKDLVGRIVTKVPQRRAPLARRQRAGRRAGGGGSAAASASTVNYEARDYRIAVEHVSQRREYDDDDRHGRVQRHRRLQASRAAGDAALRRLRAGRPLRRRGRRRGHADVASAAGRRHLRHDAGSCASRATSPDPDRRRPAPPQRPLVVPPPVQFLIAPGHLPDQHREHTGSNSGRRSGRTRHFFDDRAIVRASILGCQHASSGRFSSSSSV